MRHASILDVNILSEFAVEYPVLSTKTSEKGSKSYYQKFKSKLQKVDN